MPRNEASTPAIRDPTLSRLGVRHKEKYSDFADKPAVLPEERAGLDQVLEGAVHLGAARAKD